VRGAKTDFIDGKFSIETYPDLGYSFCNCKNIFYTNWANIRQSVYDEDYSNKHKTKEVENLCNNYWKMYENLFDTEGKEFLEIGSINSYILDNAKKCGFKTTGLDIFNHKDFKHELIVSDFETWDGNIWFDDFKVHKKFDVIWASHVFEHFKDPILALKKCYESMNENGILLVAMPDIFFINWNSVYSWCHWHLREHHIMWDMDSFCDEAIKIGFKIELKKRNTISKIETFGDYHILMRKL
jgi:SAM-dependent methyltransferase